MFALRVTRRGHSQARGSWHPRNNVQEPKWPPRIILPKPEWHHDDRLVARWHPGPLSQSHNGTPFSLFWSRWHPGSLSWSEKGALGPLSWSHKTPRDHSFGARWHPGSFSRSPKSTPGSLSGARMALRRPVGAPEAKSSIPSSNLTSPEGVRPAPTRL